MTTSTIAKVICVECRHENEAERIYCHNCGARLDRTAVRVEKEPVDDTRRRVRKMFNPQGVRLRAFLSKTIKLILAACGIAALVQMVLPPDMPSSARKTTTFGSQMRFDLESMSTRRQPPQVQYTEDQANAYLTYVLRPKQKSLDKPLLDFKRAVVALREGSCAVTAEDLSSVILFIPRASIRRRLARERFWQSTRARVSGG
jgi:hypothetical protein